MRRFIPVAAVLLLTALLAHAGSKGFCPPPPPAPDKAPPSDGPAPHAPTPDAQLYAVSLLTVVSDKGYVCSAYPIGKTDKELGKKAVQLVRAWKLDPAKKNGRPVAVTVVITVNFWRKPNGEFIEPTGPQASKASTEVHD